MKGSAARPLVIIGNPGSRRIALLQERLRQHGLPPAPVISYLELLVGQALSDHAPAGALVRIESPGESFAVEQALLRAGEGAARAEGAPCLSRVEVDALLPDHGRIRCPRQWYLGFRALLEALAVQGEELNVTWTSTPGEIALLFDKPAAQAHLAARGVPVPESLGHVTDYETLRARMRARGLHRVFVKLAHGSSASGVLALHDLGGGLRAYTTVERVAGRGHAALYNSRHIRCYQSETEIAEIIDALCAEGVQAERWLPKASCAAGNFDLRILVVAGRACLQVMRVQRSPMTNLHLGSRRGDLGELRRNMGDTAWNEMLGVAEHAARQHPGALQVGVDLMLLPGLRQPHVLEANAFGDLLPGVQCGGRDAYGHQLAALFPDHTAERAAA